MRSVLRLLFNSDFFKNARFSKVKSPTEFVVGTVRLAGGHRFLEVEDISLALETGYMGQKLLDPPSVEGWHTGSEWVNSSALMNRVNFASQQVADTDKPGVRSIIERIQAQDPMLSVEQVVDGCLELMGPLIVSEQTRQDLIDHLAVAGDSHDASNPDSPSSPERVRELLQLIVATREYQLA